MSEINQHSIVCTQRSNINKRIYTSSTNNGFSDIDVLTSISTSTTIAAFTRKIQYWTRIKWRRNCNVNAEPKRLVGLCLNAKTVDCLAGEHRQFSIDENISTLNCFENEIRPLE